jgi:hypothetical protein
MRLMLMTFAVVVLAAVGAGAIGGPLGGGRNLPAPAAVAEQLPTPSQLPDNVRVISLAEAQAMGLIPGPVPQAPILPTPEQATVLSFISDAVKRAEADTFVNLSGQKGAAVYVPLRVLDWPIESVGDVGIGGAGGLGKPEGIVSARINLPQVANAIFGTRWLAANSHGPVLPSMFLGPALKASWPPSSFRWDREVLFLLGLPFDRIGAAK